MSLRPYSASVLALGGVILMILGLYFVFVRPPLLPEDLRYIGKSLTEIQATVPGLLIWLSRVFWAMGGFIFASGLLTFYVATTAFRMRVRGIASVVIVTALASIGWMTAINFIIASDFKWLMLSFVLLWVLALLFYRLEKPRSETERLISKH